MLLLLLRRSHTTTAAARRLLGVPQGRSRATDGLPSKAMATTSASAGGGASSSSLASAKASLRKAMKAKLAGLPDEMLTEECAFWN